MQARRRTRYQGDKKKLTVFKSCTVDISKDATYTQKKYHKAANTGARQEVQPTVEGNVRGGRTRGFGDVGGAHLEVGPAGS